MASNQPIIIFIFYVFLGVALVGVVIYFQLKLEKKDGKFLGLLLPGASFVISILVAIGMLISETINPLNGYYVAFIWFGILNIPTVALLIVHYWSRNKRNMYAQVEKMNIQDL